MLLLHSRSLRTVIFLLVHGILSLMAGAQVAPVGSSPAPNPTPASGENLKKSLKIPAESTLSASDTNAVRIPADRTPYRVETNQFRDDSSRTNRRALDRRLRLYPARMQYDPRIAWKRSAILPGWGQLYNRRWWKVPIIYAGFGTICAFIYINNQGYREYDDAVKCKGDLACTEDPFPYYDIPGVISIRESYRRYRDLGVIVCGLWYLLNVVDAYVDAHLRGFNVSDDLSLHLRPSLSTDPFNQNRPHMGLSLALNLRP
jgi:Family of unknown function (DUF5683)